MQNKLFFILEAFYCWLAKETQKVCKLKKDTSSVIFVSVCFNPGPSEINSMLAFYRT